MITAILVLVTMALACVIGVVVFAVRGERRFQARAHGVLHVVGMYIDDEARDLVHADIRASLACERQARKVGVLLGILSVMWGIMVLCCVLYVL